MNTTALLIDLDGVIYVQEKLIPGAIETIHFIRQKNIPHRFVTNTTTHSRRQIIGRLAQVGMAIPHDHLFTAPVAAAQCRVEQERSSSVDSISHAPSSNRT